MNSINLPSYGFTACLGGLVVAGVAWAAYELSKGVEVRKPSINYPDMWERKSGGVTERWNLNHPLGPYLAAYNHKDDTRLYHFFTELGKMRQREAAPKMVGR